MDSLIRSALTLALLGLAGCASLPREQAHAGAQALVQARLQQAPVPIELGAEPAIPSAPVELEQAIRLAFGYHPRVALSFAELGLGQAELERARRLANPGFGLARLSLRGEPGHGISREFGVDLADWLLLPSRKRLAQGELERLQQAVAAEWLALASEVEQAWLQAVSAAQVASMRAAVARAGAASARLAERFVAAGNLAQLQLDQLQAAAATARIAALRADAEALRARSALARLIGLPSEAEWRLPARLPLPHGSAPTLAHLLALAQAQRPDLAAAERAVQLRADALALQRRWRWLGGVELGYEHEREPGAGEQGPRLALTLPIFDQGQPAIAAASAELEAAQARRALLLAELRHATAQAREQMVLAQQLIERYRRDLLPRREAVVGGLQQRVNFMLSGVFELIEAKQDEYDAFQDYLEAVRDYWLARAELRAQVGGRLPETADSDAGSVGVDDILPAAEAAADPHHHHQQHQHQHQHGRSSPPTAPRPPAEPRQSHGHGQDHRGDRSERPAQGDTP